MTFFNSLAPDIIELLHATGLKTSQALRQYTKWL